MTKEEALGASRRAILKGLESYAAATEVSRQSAGKPFRGRVQLSDGTIVETK
jgi:hypothetical protein